jgi:sister chromatid cohesion protein DCC1
MPPSSLTLESSPTSAILKHGSQSWGMRQKNTSNALMLLSPADATAEPQESSQVPEPGLRAIAIVHDTIELIPETSASAAPAARGKWHEKFARSR